MTASHRSHPSSPRLLSGPRSAVSAVLAFAALAALILAAPAPALAERVFIDPGHGGRYPGAVYAGLREADVNLWLALQTRAALVSRGHDVAMSRTDDSTVGGGIARPAWHWDDDGVHFRTCDAACSHDAPISDLQARCDIANRWGADVFISIHNNAGGSTARGTETYHDFDGEDGIELSRDLAQAVQDGVVSRAGTIDRGVFEVGFYVVRWSNMPAVLVEVGFLSSYSDRALLTSPSFRSSVAQGIADGVDRFLTGDPFRPLHERLAGADRYATAAEVSAKGWPGGADTVLLASGEDWPDSLAATPLSKRLDAPVLLTRTDSLPGPTADEIARLRPERVIVLGGTGAVSAVVAEAVAEAAALPPEVPPAGTRDTSSTPTTSTPTTETPPAPSIEPGLQRIAGVDRYETAALIAETIGLSAHDRVFLVSGEMYPDALSASSYAGISGTPILMTRTGFLSPPTEGFLDRRATMTGGPHVVVVGGAGAVSDEVVYRVDERFGDVQRLWGWDRYDTNLAVLRAYWPTIDLEPLVATAEDYPDALVAGALAAKRRQPVLLVGRGYLPARHREMLMNEADRFDGFTMIGGDGAVSKTMDWQLAKAMR